MNNVPDIFSSNHTTIFGWTFENFLKYVQYESMFYDSCKREPAEVFQKGDSGIACVYKLKRRAPGYSGFMVDSVTTIVLSNPDGIVPPFDPELDTQETP